MELMKGGSEPATKEDLRQLEASMLAGFEAIATQLNQITLMLLDSHGELAPSLQDVAIRKTQEHLYTNLDAIRKRLLNK